MLAALSTADHGLFERMMEAVFPPQHLSDSSGSSTPGANGRVAAADPRSNSALSVGPAIKKKTIDTVLACKEMLLKEPPERMTEFWGTVSSLSHPNSSFPTPSSRMA